MTEKDTCPTLNEFKNKENVSIVLPCEQDVFGHFIAGLLGKPQTIEQTLNGIFTIKKEDVINTFHLLDQRIHQQNEASLIQFTVKIFYEDNSSVLLNSLEEFTTYREVRPMVSESVHLSWTYLIKFQDKKVPEKQEIELSFHSDGRGIIINRIGIFSHFSEHSVGYIRLNIRHTARTWGVDIESLLSGHIKSLLKEESKFKKMLYEHSSKLGWSSSIIFIFLVLIGAYRTTGTFIQAQMKNAQTLLAIEPSGITSIAEKVNFLIQQQAKGAWSQFSLFIITFLFVVFLFSIFLKIWVQSCANNTPKSFVILSQKSEERKQKQLDKRKKRWWYLMASLFASVATGVFANFIFHYLSRNWIQ